MQLISSMSLCLCNYGKSRICFFRKFLMLTDVSCICKKTNSSWPFSYKTCRTKICIYYTEKKCSFFQSWMWVNKRCTRLRFLIQYSFRGKARKFFTKCCYCNAFLNVYYSKNSSYLHNWWWTRIYFSKQDTPA